MIEKGEVTTDFEVINKNNPADLKELLFDTRVTCYWLNNGDILFSKTGVVFGNNIGYTDGTQESLDIIYRLVFNGAMEVHVLKLV